MPWADGTECSPGKASIREMYRKMKGSDREREGNGQMGINRKGEMKRKIE